MKDMDPQAVTQGGRLSTLRYFDGRQRQIVAREEEVPYPEGQLIVSRTDPRGIITHANEAFVRISGYSREELVGEPHYILRHPDMPAAAFADLWQTIERGDRWHGYVKNLCKDGRYYWVYATVIPNVRQGKIVGYSSIRRKPSRRKVEEAIAQYRDLNRAAAP